MAHIIAEFPNANLTISSTLRRRVTIGTGRTFLSIKQEILGKSYDLSVVFVGVKRSRKLNRTWRGKDKPTDILSFPLGETAGEVLICPEIADKKAPLYDRSPDTFYLYLFIHGLFHLKGMDHGSRMEESEKQVRQRFDV